MTKKQENGQASEKAGWDLERAILGQCLRRLERLSPKAAFRVASYIHGAMEDRVLDERPKPDLFAEETDA